MIVQNILRRKGRTTMCIAAIAISTALLVSLLSVAEGIWQNASYSILSSHEDIIIRPNLPPGGGLPVINNGHRLANELKLDTTNISEVSPTTLWWLEINPAQPAAKSTIPPKSGVVVSLGIIPERFKKFFTCSRGDF